MTNEELVTQINTLTGTVNDIKSKVDALEAEIQSAGDTVPQNVVDAFTALQDAVNQTETDASGNQGTTGPVKS